MRLTEKQLEEKKQQGMIRDYRIVNNNVKKCNTNRGNRSKKAQKRSKEKDWLAWNLMFWANEKAVELKEEHRVTADRKWRFDYAFPSLKIGIEYEGIFSEKSRHTTAKGYTGDADKYNQGQLEGWRIIRITALNYKTILKTLNEYYDREILQRL